MQQQKINKWGNGQGFRIDKKTLETLHLKVGDKVEYKIEQGHLLIIPVREERLLTEEYLISQLDSNSFDDLSEDMLPEELEF